MTGGNREILLEGNEEKAEERESAMGRVFTAVRALVYGSGFVFLWGWLALTAARLDRAAGRELPDVFPAHLVGLVLMVAGGLLALSCAVLFVVSGDGTPAPFDAPRRFVAVGPYRLVRNPMYVGAITLLVGLSLSLRAPSVFGVAAAAFLFSSLFVVFVEEPSLARRFGDAYAAYRRATNRWIPRVPRAA